MPYFNRRRGMSLRPVNRIKHVFDVQDALAIGTQKEKNPIVAVDAPVLANTFEVQTGCTVNAIYLDIEVVATSSAALPNVYLAVWKNPGNNLTIPAPNTIGASDNKRFAIHQEMVMLQQQTNSNPRTLFKGVIVIPKGYRRFAPNDRLTVSLLSPGVTVSFCIQAHYK